MTARDLYIIINFQLTQPMVSAYLMFSQLISSHTVNLLLHKINSTVFKCTSGKIFYSTSTVICICICYHVAVFMAEQIAIATVWPVKNTLNFNFKCLQKTENKNEINSSIQLSWRGGKKTNIRTEQRRFPYLILRSYIIKSHARLRAWNTSLCKNI